MIPLGRVAVVGAGQVGTMIGATLVRQRRAAGVSSVSVYDADPEVAQAALERGAGDLVLADPRGALEADLVVLAVPVTEIIGWVREFGPFMAPGRALLDTGSAKAEVVAAMAHAIPGGVHAVGGHPMAGNEGYGPGAAEPDALRGAVFAITPCRADEEALRIAIDLASACGARPLVIDAVRHDRLVARTSHLPHLLASALAVVAAEVEPDTALTGALAGSGYEGSSRLAASDSRMVAAFASANRGQLESALGEFRAALVRLEAALGEEPPALELELSRGRRARALVLER